jgi:hypothetical protein
MSKIGRIIRPIEPTGPKQHSLSNKHPLPGVSLDVEMNRNGNFEPIENLLGGKERTRARYYARVRRDR